MNGCIQRVQSARGEVQTVAIEDVEKSGSELGDNVRNAESRAECIKTVREKAGGLSPIVENNTVRVTVEGQGG
jgi:hypothetical protein